MPRHASSFLRRAGLALVIGLGVHAVAEAQPARADLDARIDRLTRPLDLSAAQASRLDAVAAQYADAERSDLWAAAAAVQDVLTEAQVASLRQAAEVRREARSEARADRRAPRRDRMRRGARRGDRGRDGRGMRGGGREMRRTDLTDAQRQSLREIRQETRRSAEALVDQLRAGSISDDAFVTRTRALHQEAARRATAVLPAEVAQRQAARRSAREAEAAARESALGLSEAQRDRLQALRLDRTRTRPERLDLRPYLDDDGQLDRQAYREALRERREAQRETRGDRRDEMADVLTQEQQDLTFLHRALAARGGRAARGARRNGRGR